MTTPTEPGWPRIIEVGERVEVELAALTNFPDPVDAGFVRGLLIEKDVTDVDDPEYLVEMDAPYKVVHPLGIRETDRCRWFAWEFVRPLNILELLAEAAQ